MDDAPPGYFNFLRHAASAMRAMRLSEFSRCRRPTSMSLLTSATGEFTILECAKVVLEVTGSSSKIWHEPLPQDDPRQRCPDISKAKRLLAWEPVIDLRTGLQMSLDYFRCADHCPAAEGTTSRVVQSGLGVHLRMRGLQPGPLCNLSMQPV